MSAATRGSAARDRPVRVALDARIRSQIYGGVQQTITGLATGLSRLEGDDEYLFIGNEDSGNWLGPYVRGPCQLVIAPTGSGETRRRATYERLSAGSPRAARLIARAGWLLGRAALAIPASDGFVESLRPDVVHFTTQQAFTTEVPSVYQIHDLQHVHHPELLTPLQVRYREMAYRTFCSRASLVAVMTEWGRSDVCAWAGIQKTRTVVVPWAPAAGLDTISDETSGALEGNLPHPFLLYPAQTWPHKNHLRLLEAVKLLQNRGQRIGLVCTGHRNDHYAAIQRRIRELRLGDDVCFAGYVSDGDLARLYRRATALVFPSLFEGWGLPIVEAFQFGVPVACSTASVLPEVVGDAALLFDPEDVEDMASALATIVTDDSLRRGLVDRGRRRVATLSWDRSARTFRAVYRYVAGRELGEEDRFLLAPPAMVR